MYLLYKHNKALAIFLGWILIHAFAAPSAALGRSDSDISKLAFYNAFSSTSLSKIDNALTHISDNSSTISNAYKGALLMKKASFLKSKKEQLENFKDGRNRLESAIRQDPQNAEFRFMRIAIQEKAPRILGYNKNINEDKKILIKAFEQMDETAKSAILDYAKTSAALSQLIH